MNVYEEPERRNQNQKAGPHLSLAKTSPLAPDSRGMTA